MRSSSKGNGGVSGGRAGGIGASDGDGSNRNNNGCSSDGDSFVKRISEMFMKWKVRPDMVLRGRHENKSKGALSAFWQDYKKVRVDWRASAGMRRDHFELALQHYMRIDGPSRDTCEGRIRYIWETRIRDNSHLGVVDVSCQPAKAKVGKRRNSSSASQKEDIEHQHILQHQKMGQSQQHYQLPQARQIQGADGGAAGGFGLPGLHSGSSGAASSRLYQTGNNAGGGASNGLSAVGVSSGPGTGGATPYDSVTPGVSPAGSNQSGSRLFSPTGTTSGSATGSGGGDTPGRLGGRRGTNDVGWVGDGRAQGRGVVGVKGEMARANSGEEDSMRKRPRESWGEDSADAGTTSSGAGRVPQRSSSASQLALASTSGTNSAGPRTPGGKKDRIPNHWWELELTPEGPMLYPTSNCHEWTSDNGIEHRIMEIEFQHGSEVKPPKDRLIKDFTLNWRPNSDIVYVFETEGSRYFAPVCGMYEKQTITHNKKFLYRQMQPHPWSVTRERGWGADGEGEGTQMRTAWLFNDSCTGHWMVALDYQEQPCSPIYQYPVPQECARTGTPCMDLNTFTSNTLKVKGCTTLIPPLEVLLLSENSVREVCAKVWKGCFTADPPEVAFDLLCRLMSMSESHYLPDDSDRYAAEIFDAQRLEILAFFLVGGCDDPADRVVQRDNYLAFMEWFVYTLPEVALPVKIWRMYHALHDDDIPFVSFPLSRDKSAFYSHRQAMSGPAIPGRFSFRFSRQPYHVTVDYTVQGRTIEGRPQATVMSYRIKISFINIRMVMLRIENLLLRGDGAVTQGGQLLEESSLWQGIGRSENGVGTIGAGSGGGPKAAAVGHAAGAPGPGVTGNVGHPESGLGSLEQVIAQVDMEESTGGRAKQHLRVPVDETNAYGQGHRAGAGGPGGPTGNGNADPNSGWTDMFHGGMTVGLMQQQAAQLPGDAGLHLSGGVTLGSLAQQQLSGAGGNGGQSGPGNHTRDPHHHAVHSHHNAHHAQQQNPHVGASGHHGAHHAANNRPEHLSLRDERDQAQQHRQHGSPRMAVTRDASDRRGVGVGQATYNTQGRPPYIYPPGESRMIAHAGHPMVFFDEPPPSQHDGGGNTGGVHGGPGNGGMMNLEYVEFASFQELLMFFRRTLTERYDSSRQEQESIPSPMYMHNMDD